MASEKREVGEVTFLSEQDGPAEKLLKDNLLPMFARHSEVSSAYLCSIRYSDDARSVALCLKVQGDPRSVVSDAGSIFSRIFKTGEHLDIIILSSRQESEIAETCDPFYRDQL
jgi:hypothetical protein